MKPIEKQRTQSAVMRRRAEEIAGKQEALSLDKLQSLSLEEVQAIVHELRVHQVELEMQNEELQRTQYQLECSHKRYVDLYDNAPVGYLTIGENGTIQSANLTATVLLGVERSKLTNQPLSNFIAFDDQDIYYLLCKQLLATGERQICELRFKKPDSTTFWTRIETTLDRSNNNTPQCRLIISDVTERKRTDGERAMLLSRLAQAQKLEAIGTLAGGVAHDFNNILAGILGGLSLLELDKDDGFPRFQQDIDQMKLLVERATNLTKQLLGFARRGSYDARPLDVTRVAKQTLELFGRARKDLILVDTSTLSTATVLIDHTHLEQILLNLFINTGQAMPEGGTLTLAIETTELEQKDVESHEIEPGHFVKLVIKDTGIGMNTETQMRIFEPFFTTKFGDKGTGLGLASVYGIVKSHGGFVRVESELGKGSTFTVFLPITAQPPDTEAVAPKSIKPGVGTILVIDDEEQIAKLSARMLTRIGYNVFTATSGKRALELLCQHQEEISLVILDMIMPEMSGIQTYNEIRKIAPSTKVIIVSGYSVEGEAQWLLEHGCNGFIQKPFTIADLSEKIKEIL